MSLHDDYQATIVQLARLSRWKAYHTYDSRRSSPGFPDLVLAKPKALILVEIKIPPDTLKPAQKEWGNVLSDLQCQQFNPVYYRVWTPSHQDEIEKILTEWG